MTPIYLTKIAKKLAHATPNPKQTPVKRLARSRQDFGNSEKLEQKGE